MRKIVNFYFIIQFFTILFLTFFLMFYNPPIWIWLILIASTLFSMLMLISLGNVKWHMTHEEMINAKRNSDRLVRNCTELIDEIKKQLFRQNIMTKEEVSKILDKE